MSFFSLGAKKLHLVIIGAPQSGKTMLWNKLQYKSLVPKAYSTEKDVIRSFKINIDEHKFEIASTLDLGGRDDLVRCYDEILKDDNTLILYLVNLLSLQKEVEPDDMCTRLAKISSVIRTKGFENCHCKIFATNYKAFKEYGLYTNYGNPEKSIRIILGQNILEYLSPLNMEEMITPVELNNDNDIKHIKEQIAIFA